ncbi:zinc-domain-containing protein [Nitrosopumilus sp. b3]|uniref:zinc-domain-containing protein n=1 Tax=Nitrosopumilus sp. b3 TaxID=2109909 RepID=UPI0015F6720E|nr:zinc-domain-containing protein [Nitrosopumilus sp. b3]KAF6246674.1 zinc-domain-containing protein [Nitrosopumilus sp. b3]
MDAKCPECEKVAILDDDIAHVRCPHCNFETDYDSYLEIMKDQAINMASDYIPDRPGM